MLVSKASPMTISKRDLWVFQVPPPPPPKKKKKKKSLENAFQSFAGPLINSLNFIFFT